MFTIEGTHADVLTIHPTATLEQESREGRLHHVYKVLGKVVLTLDTVDLTWRDADGRIGDAKELRAFAARVPSGNGNGNHTHTEVESETVQAASGPSPPFIAGFPDPLPNFPPELKSLKRFVVAKLELRDGDLAKVPYNPVTGKKSSGPHTSWGCSYQEAVAAFQSGGYAGLGFVFDGTDDLVFLDSDVDEPWVVEEFQKIPGYLARSYNGRWHLYTRGKKPEGAKIDFKPVGGIYATGRYALLTPNYVNGSIPSEPQDLTHIHQVFAAKKAEMLGKNGHGRNGATPKTETEEKPSLIIKAKVNPDDSARDFGYLCNVIKDLQTKDPQKIVDEFFARHENTEYGKRRLSPNGKNWGKHPIEKYFETTISNAIATVEKEIGEIQESEGTDVTEWGELQDFGVSMLPVATVDPTWIPEGIRTYVLNATQRFDTPLDFAFVFALLTIAGACCRRVVVIPKELDESWQEFLILWGGVVAEPGSRKTPCLKEFISPLKEIEERWRMEYDAAHQKYKVAHAEWEKRNKRRAR